MGAVAAIAPLISAAASLMGAMNRPEPPAPVAAPPPPKPPKAEPTVEPEGVVDAAQLRLRQLRRSQAERQRGSLAAADGTGLKKTTLLGE